MKFEEYLSESRQGKYRIYMKYGNRWIQVDFMDDLPAAEKSAKRLKGQVRNYKREVVFDASK